MAEGADRTVTSIGDEGQSDAPRGVNVEALAEGTQVGSYAITRLIGKGGMGAVYEAMHRQLGKRSAIKTLLPEHAAKPDVRERFLREGQSASKIRHTNVVDVFDVGDTGEFPYLVMEYLEGEDLSSLLHREGRLSAERAVDLLVPICGALAAAHAMGIVHRDMKPENIFLCSGRGGRIEPKLVDFGISKIDTQEGVGGLTGTSALMGTPYYMSPEQAQSAKHIDARSDQFSFGAILYEALVGSRPFSGDTLYAILDSIVRPKYPKPTSVHDDIPEELESVTLRAMSQRPEDRFPSMRALGRSLLPFAGERIRALYEEELAADDALSIPPTGEVAARSEHRVLSTLGDSAASLPAKRPTPASRLPVVLGAFAAVAALALGGVWWARSGNEASPQPAGLVSSAGPTTAVVSTREVTSTVTAPAASPEDSAAAPLPALATKTLESKPEAGVYILGKHVGDTPYKLELAPDADELEVELRAPGYLPITRRVKRSDDDPVSFVLKPKPSRGPAPPPLAPR